MPKLNHLTNTTRGSTIVCSVPKKGNHRKIDNCLSMVIAILNNNGIKTLASCCGHGKYSCTIVAEIKGFPVEIFSGRIIPRKNKFYRKDSNGYFYIPEVDMKR